MVHNHHDMLVKVVLFVSCCFFSGNSGIYSMHFMVVNNLIYNMQWLIEAIRFSMNSNASPSFVKTDL